MSLLLYAIEGISSSADDDQRRAALDPRHLLKKVDENFHNGFLKGNEF